MRNLREQSESEESVENEDRVTDLCLKHEFDKIYRKIENDFRYIFTPMFMSAKHKNFC